MIGAGGDAVISTVLPGPDVVAERTGPSSPHSPNGGTVQLSMNPVLTSRAMMGASMDLLVDWIHGDVETSTRAGRSLSAHRGQ